MPDYTLSVSSAIETRVLKAFGRHFNSRDGSDSPRDATHDEVKAFLTRKMQDVVANYERRVEEDKVSVSDISVS